MKIIRKQVKTGKIRKTRKINEILLEIKEKIWCSIRINLNNTVEKTITKLIKNKFN